MEKRNFVVVIERDENGTYVGEVPDLKGCYTQGDSVEEVMKNIREVIEMCLEEQNVTPNEFIKDSFYERFSSRKTKKQSCPDERCERKVCNGSCSW